MSKQLLFLAFIALPFFAVSQTKSSAIMGVWLTQKQDAKIEIYQKSKKYYGRVIWLAEPNGEDGKPIVDEKNPNPKLNTRPIFGMDIYSF